MKTQSEAVRAYITIVGMSKKVAGKAAFSLFRLKTALQPVVDFQTEQEQNLIEKYAGEVNDKGQVMIKDPEQREKFLAEHTELLNLPCEPEILPVTVTIDSAPEITMQEIEALDGFVNFE